jgi:methylenetetrahydrofolate dehydrogenase (NADP+)/methenyltetrahydrofolate cyclohydrolase
MAARVLDGQALGARLQQEMKPRVVEFRAQHGRPPGLGVVLVGNDPASEIYVRNKVRTAAELGFRADLERLPATATLADTLALVERLNGSDVHDGILVQSPLPKAMGPSASQRVFDLIAHEKDVDGFSPASVGLLVQNRATLVACTPAGIIELLVRENIPIEGRQAVVIGRSDIVGKPMAMLLMHRNATVTVCHSWTPNLADVCRRADILVAAIGRAGLVTPEFVKPGATVIDVGMNRVTDASVAATLFEEGHPRLEVFRQKGAVLVGDVHPRVAEVAGALTPVPGGVGPLTITMLMMNTLAAATARVGAAARSAPAGQARA